MVGLYIHIPYCKAKCRYCDFFSQTDTASLPKYVDRLLEELHTYPYGTDIDTIFFGGGTPSLLCIDDFARLFAGIRSHFHVMNNAEITVECNPESASNDLFCGLRKLGVNRISIGVQSLQTCALRWAGRIHSREQALDSVKLATQHFDNVNVDYIVGLKGQRASNVVEDIQLLISCGVSHLSLYSLIVEPHTPIGEEVHLGLYTPSDDESATLYDAGMDLLVKNGFQRYEISNFAKPDMACKHNLHCWELQEYIGLGPSSHSFFDNKRYYLDNDLDKYLMGDFTHIAEDDGSTYARQFDMLMLGLRTTQGVSLPAWEARFGRSFVTQFEKQIHFPIVKRATEISSSHFCILPEYMYISNFILEILMDGLEKQV